MGTEAVSISLMSLASQELTFQAKIIRTGPMGAFRINLLNPFSASPSVSLNVSSLILSIYSPRFTAVVTSFAVYAIGRPICSVSSLASTSCLSPKIFNAFFTIACLSARDVLRKLRKASVATSGRSLRSAAEMPFRVKIGLFVIGEMVVIVSTDILRAVEPDFVELKDVYEGGGMKIRKKVQGRVGGIPH